MEVIDIAFLGIHNWKEATIVLVYFLYLRARSKLPYWAVEKLDESRSFISVRSSPSAIMSCEFSNHPNTNVCDRGVDLLVIAIANFMCRCRCVLCLQHRGRLIPSADNFATKKKPRRDTGKRAHAEILLQKCGKKNKAQLSRTHRTIGTRYINVNEWCFRGMCN